MNVAQLKQLAKQKAKALVAGVLAAIALYVYGCVKTGSPLSLSGLIAAVIASPAIAGVVHWVSNAEAPEDEPAPAPPRKTPAKPKPRKAPAKKAG